VLPGGAIHIGGGFVVRSILTSSSGPSTRTLGATAHNTSGWTVTTVKTSASSWSVTAVTAAYRLERIVTRTTTRLEVNDTLVSRLKEGVLGLQVQHILAFPAGSTATDALVPGSRFIEHGALCDTTGNYDYIQGMYMGTFGNPTVWATDGVVGVGL
jgi:hypothetical protein